MGVVGAGIADRGTARLAEAVGAALARAGAVLVCGGMTGVMEAACKGAKSAGGTTIGILPGLDRRDANPYVDVAIATGMGEMRNALIARAVDVMIAVDGEFGTLSEIAFALKIGTPVVGLDTWELHRSGTLVEAIEVASSPQEAVTKALQAASAR